MAEEQVIKGTPKIRTLITEAPVASAQSDEPTSPIITMENPVIAMECQDTAQGTAVNNTNVEETQDVAMLPQAVPMDTVEKQAVPVNTVESNNAIAMETTDTVNL